VWQWRSVSPFERSFVMPTAIIVQTLKRYSTQLWRLMRSYCLPRVIHGLIILKRVSIGINEFKSRDNNYPAPTPTLLHRVVAMECRARSDQRMMPTLLKRPARSLPTPMLIYSIQPSYHLLTRMRATYKYPHSLLCPPLQ